MAIPPEISADEHDGVPPVEQMYRCPDCEMEFLKLSTLEEHWYFSHSGLAVDEPEEKL